MKFSIKYIVILALISSTLSVTAQKEFTLSLQAPVQLDYQRAEITYGPYEIQKNTTINFGCMGSVTRQLSKKIYASVGIGYFRERFTIRRPYDHQQLNPGVDSILILTKTNYYTYHLVSFPLSVKVAVKSLRNPIFCKLEYVPAFYFSKSYIGGKPFSTANTSQSRFDFWSHSINLKMEFMFHLNEGSSLSVEPFIRLLHVYRGDTILFEDKKGKISRNMDATGISLIYYTQPHHKKNK